MTNILRTILDVVDIVTLPHTENPFEDKMDEIMYKTDCENLKSDWSHVGDDMKKSMHQTQLRLNEQKFTTQQIEFGHTEANSRGESY